MKKLFTAMLLAMSIIAASMSTQVNAAEVKTEDTKQTVTINNTTLEFDNIVFIATDGNDETGDGSKNKPYRSYYTAYNNSKDGDCIFFMPGEYNLDKIVYTKQEFASKFRTLKRYVIGCNEKTILNIDTSDIDFRDTPIIGNGLSADAQLYNLHIRFNMREKNTENYQSALFEEVSGRINNVYFENIGTEPVSYSQFNGSAQVPFINNCTFSIKSALNDNSGTPTFTNCLFDKFIMPNKGNGIIRPITEADFNKDVIPADLRNKGTGLNPDGSQAHIGVYGGEFAWGGTIKVNDKVMNDVDTPEIGDKLYVLLAPKEETQLILTEDLADNTTYKWSSSNPSAATVDENGKVAAIKEGTSKITVASADGSYEDSIYVKVLKDAKEKRLSVYLRPGQKQKLYIADDLSKVTWSSMDSSVAEVSADGTVTAIGKGLAVIQGEYNSKTHLIYVRVN